MRDILNIINENLMPNIDAAFDEFDGMTEPHPSEPDVRVFDGVDIELQTWGTNFVIEHIKSSAPRTGAGKKAMQMICAIADKHRVVTNLTANAYGEDADHMNTEQLVEWYKSFGFEMHRDEESDSFGDDEDGWYMIRHPR